MEKNEKYVPCFLCALPLDVRESFKGKPYLVCDNCGIQIFIRGKSGIKRFQTFIDKIISGARRGKK